MPFRSSNSLLEDSNVNTGDEQNINMEETPIAKKRFKTGIQSTDWISDERLLLDQPSSSSSLHSLNLQSSENPSTSANNEYDDPLMECDGIRLHEKTTYKAAGLKLTLHGVVYQLQMLMLFLHRSIKAYDYCYLATEMVEAKKFDDVVLKYKISKEDPEWTWRFLQVKHVLNVNTKQIRESQLFSPKNDKHPFSLYKYFLSFCEIEQSQFFIGSHLKDFIICTNAELDQSADKYFIKDESLKNDKILSLEYFDLKVFKLHSRVKANLEKKYVEKLPENKLLNEFLKKFRLITNFPNEKELNKLMLRELGDKYGLLNAELVTNTFKSDMLKWLMSYKQGKSEYLPITDGKGFFEDIEKQIRTLMIAGLAMAYPEKLRSYGISFHNVPENIKQFLLNTNCQVLHLESNSTLLTSIKVDETLKNIDQYNARDSYIFVTIKQALMINIKRLIYNAFSSPISHNLLVINLELKKIISKTNIKDFYSELLKILSNYPYKKLITITSSHNSGQLTKMLNLMSDNNSIKIDDSTTYSQLNGLSQKNMLKKKVFFQGKCISLKQIINTCSADILFNETLLTLFLKNVEIHIGNNEVQRWEQNLTTSYLPRTFRCPTVKSEIFQNLTFIFSNIIFLTGANEKDLADLNIGKYRHYAVEDNKTSVNGIIVPPVGTTEKKTFKIFQDLCKSHEDKNVYWIKYKDGKLAWEDSSGNDITLITNRDNGVYPDYITEEDLLQTKYYSRKTYIISGEPGIGKSALSVNLFHSLKKINPLYWISRINLNEYGLSNSAVGYQTLDDITFSEMEIEKAIQFTADIVIPESSKKETCFQRKLLKLALQNLSDNYKYPKIIILFDGFDEISPTYKEKTIVLLKALQKSNISQLWVTSRTHEVLSLEENLKLPALSLDPFTYDQKITYVTNIFRECSELSRNILNIDEFYNLLCVYLEEVRKKENFQFVPGQLKSLDERLRNALNTDFTNNPLHLRMITEIISRSKNSLYKDIYLHLLYSEFAKTKFDIFYDQKGLCGGSVTADEMRERDLIALKKTHQHFALNELLPKLCKKNNTGMDKSQLARVGFLVINQSVIRFVHRSFAEYFLADYLDENFENPEVQNILINFILYDSSFSVVRKFLNDSNSFLSQLKDNKHNIFPLISEKKKYDWIFYVLVEEKNKNMLKSLLINAKTFYCPILNNMGTNLHDLSVQKLTETRHKMLNLIQIILFDTEIFSILLDDVIAHKKSRIGSCRDGSCFHLWAIYYSGTNNTYILDRIFQMTLEKNGLSKSLDENTDVLLKLILKLLKRRCLKGQSIFHKIARRGRFDLIQDLILWLKHNTSDESVINRILLMVTYDHQTFLHVSNYNDSFASFLSFLFQIFDKCILKKLILQTDSWGKTIFHYYVTIPLKYNEVMHPFLNILIENFTKQDITDILLTVDIEGNTALHGLNTVIRNNDSFRLLLEFVISHLEPNTCKQLLLTTNLKGRSILFNAVCDDIILSELLEYCKTSFTKEFLESFIFCIYDGGQTVLHTIIEHYRYNVSKALIVLLEFVKHYFGLKGLNKIIFQTDFYGRTVFHCASSSGTETVEPLLNYTKNNFDLATVKTLVLQPDDGGLTGLHFAVQNAFESAMSPFLRFVKTNFHVAVLNEILLAKDLQARNVLHWGARNNMYGGSFKVLLEFLSNCDIRVVRELLLTKNVSGNTPFDIAEKKVIFEPIYTCFIEKLVENSRASKERKCNIIFTALEVELLYDHIYLFFHWDNHKQEQYAFMLDEYLKEFPIDS